MGAYEIIVFSDAVIFPFHGPPPERKVSLHHFFPLSRNSDRNRPHPGSFLCLYKSFGPGFFYSGYRHIYCERSVCFLDFLQTYTILQSKTIHCFSVHSDRHSLFLLYPVYLPSPGPCHLCRAFRRNLRRHFSSKRDTTQF